MTGFDYLATVYTKHPQGQHVAWLQACRWAAEFIKAGVPVFSPIAYTHQIAIQGLMNPLNHDFWMAIDRPFMEAARGLIVVTSEGWLDSVGIAEEIAYFAGVRKPIRYWAPGAPVVAQEAAE